MERERPFPKKELSDMAENENKGSDPKEEEFFFILEDEEEESKLSSPVEEGEEEEFVLQEGAGDAPQESPEEVMFQDFENPEDSSFDVNIPEFEEEMARESSRELVEELGNFDLENDAPGSREENILSEEFSPEEDLELIEEISDLEFVDGEDTDAGIDEEGLLAPDEDLASLEHDPSPDPGTRELDLDAPGQEESGLEDEDMLLFLSQEDEGEGKIDESLFQEPDSDSGGEEVSLSPLLTEEDKPEQKGEEGKDDGLSEIPPWMVPDEHLKETEEGVVIASPEESLEPEEMPEIKLMPMDEEPLEEEEEEESLETAEEEGRDKKEPTFEELYGIVGPGGEEEKSSEFEISDSVTLDTTSMIRPYAQEPREKKAGARFFIYSAAAAAILLAVGGYFFLLRNGGRKKALPVPPGNGGIKVAKTYIPEPKVPEDLPPPSLVPEAGNKPEVAKKTPAKQTAKEPVVKEPAPPTPPKEGKKVAKADQEPKREGKPERPPKVEKAPVVINEIPSKSEPEKAKPEKKTNLPAEPPPSPGFGPKTLASRLMSGALGIVRGSQVLVKLKNGNFFTGRFQKAREEFVVLEVEKGEIAFCFDEINDMYPLGWNKAMANRNFPEGSVILKNSNRFTGEIIEVDDGSITLGKGSARITIPKEYIKQFEKGKPMSIELKVDPELASDLGLEPPEQMVEKKRKKKNREKSLIPTGAARELEILLGEGEPDKKKEEVEEEKEPEVVVPVAGEEVKGR